MRSGTTPGSSPDTSGRQGVVVSSGWTPIESGLDRPIAGMSSTPGRPHSGPTGTLLLGEDLLLVGEHLVGHDDYSFNNEVRDVSEQNARLKSVANLTISRDLW